MPSIASPTAARLLGALFGLGGVNVTRTSNAPSSGSRSPIALWRVAGPEAGPRQLARAASATRARVGLEGFVWIGSAVTAPDEAPSGGTDGVRVTDELRHVAREQVCARRASRE